MAQKKIGVWGIDLGNCALKAIRLEERDGKVVATNFDYIEHPKILSQPDADPDELTRQALQKFLERNDVRGDMVAIGVPGQSGLARFVKLPPVEEKKIEDIVHFEAKQQIPFPLDEVVWDYQKISKGTVSDGYAMETEIGLFAMKRDMVNRAIQQFAEVGIEVHIVQMTPLALVNYAAFDILGKEFGPDGLPLKEDDSRGEKNCIVVFDIGADTSNLVITDGDRVIWQRTIPIGGNRFTRDLTREMKLTFAKAEHLKRNAAKSPDLKRILLALKPGLNEFVNEVQRSLGYFTNTHRNANIRYMVGMGSVFRLPGLQKFLEQKLQLPVKRLQRLFRIEGGDIFNSPQFRDNVISFAVSCGLALQGLEKTRIQTNLLPREIRIERMVRAKKPWAVATAAALLLAVAGMVFGYSVDYYVYEPSLNKRLAAAMKQGQEVIKQANTIQSDLDAELAKIDASKKTVARIAAGVDERFNWDLMYKYVNECLPQPAANRRPAHPRLSSTLRKAPDDWRFRVAYESFDGQPARQRYLTNKAIVAFEEWLRRMRASTDESRETDAKKKKEQAKIEADMRKNLVMINIEGVNCQYAEDLTKFFTNLKENSNTKLLGLTEKEKQNIDGQESLPSSGWVFEIRGYTEWQPDPNDDPKRFIVATIIHNLRNPTSRGVDIPLTPEMKERVFDRMSYVVLYKQEFVEGLPPNRLTLAGKSHLADVLGKVGTAAGGEGIPPGGGASPPGGAGSPPGGEGGATTQSDSRSGWSPPPGSVAAKVLTGAAATGGTTGGQQGSTPTGGGTTATPAGNTVPRTEFIIFFIWQEPTLEGDDTVASDY